jgi:long-chain acyl-CoA synthetase
MNTVMSQVMVSAAQRFDHKAAIIVGNSQISFFELDLWSSRIAHSLQELGVGKGDRVSLYAQSGLYWVAAYYGIFKAGGVVNPINMGFPVNEVAVAIKTCDAVAVIGTADLLGNLLPYSSTLKVQHWIALDGPNSTPLLDFAGLRFTGKADYDAIDVQENDLAVIAYTSGTTGYSKAAMLTHRGLLMVASNCIASQERSELDTVVTAIPSFHVHGAMVLNSAMMAGMTLVLHPDFSPEQILTSIEKHRATLFEGMPIMFLSMLGCINQVQYDLSSLTRCTIAGQSISIAKIQQMEEIFGCPVIELWGQTETCGACTSNPLTGKKIGSIGLPLPDVMMRIADPKDYRLELHNNEVGELLIKSPMLMQGYLNNPQLSAKVIEADGWFHTGDLCYKDEDGFFYLIDRLVDMITVNGRSVYPAEVEHVIAEHVRVSLVGVIGVSHVDGNEQQVKAYVVAAPLTQIDLDDLLCFCRAHLEVYQIPTIIQIVDDLPKTATGKVSRHALRLL